MRTLIASCLVAVAWAVLAVPARAGDDSASLTVVLRVGSETKYAEVVKIVNTVREAQVSWIQLEIAGQQPAGVSAVIRAKSDTPYREVVRALEALQVAGVRTTTLKPER